MYFCRLLNADLLVHFYYKVKSSPFLKEKNKMKMPDGLFEQFDISHFKASENTNAVNLL